MNDVLLALLIVVVVGYLLYSILSFRTIKRRLEKLEATERPPENEYQKLIAYFKLLVSLTTGIVVIIVGIGSYFLGRNLEDVRTTAERLATDEAKNKVAESFKEPNIQRMIDSAAHKVIKESLESTFREQIEKSRLSQSDAITVNLVSEAVARIRNGEYTGITDIQNIISDPKTEPSIRTSTQRQYDYLVKDIENKALQGDTSLGGLLGPMGIELSDRKSNLQLLIKSLLEPTLAPMAYERTFQFNVNVARGYVALRKLTGMKIKTFDTKTLAQWLKQHPEFKSS